MSINGIVAGPTLGLFTLGMFCPWIGSRTAGLGFISGLSIAIFLYVFSHPTNQFTKLLDGKSPALISVGSLSDPTLWPLRGLDKRRRRPMRGLLIGPLRIIVFLSEHG